MTAQPGAPAAQGGCISDKSRNNETNITSGLRGGSQDVTNSPTRGTERRQLAVPSVPCNAVGRRGAPAGRSAGGLWVQRGENLSQLHCGSVSQTKIHRAAG